MGGDQERVVPFTAPAEYEVLALLEIGSPDIPGILGSTAKRVTHKISRIRRPHGRRRAHDELTRAYVLPVCVCGRVL